MSNLLLEDITFIDQLVNKLPFAIHGWAWVISIMVVLYLVDKFVLKKWDIANQLKEKNIAVAVVVGAFILGMFILAGSANGAETTRYDKYFERYTKQYWGAEIDWRLFKAQAMQESLLNPRAVSPAGAKGIMQFMPATARQYRINPYNPRQSIQAGINMMRRLYNIFAGRPRPHMDKMALAAASYNWGIGNVVRKGQPCAVQRSGGDLTWRQVKPCLPAETQGYWPRIVGYFQRFIS